MEYDSHIDNHPKNLDSSDIYTTIPWVAKYISSLDAGMLAALRRGPFEGGGAVAFWRIISKFNVPEYLEYHWAVIVQAIAILTPRGERASRRSAHNPKLALGLALYQAGISELRLARLLTARQDMRFELIIRVCRRLATSKCNEFDLTTLTRLILYGDQKTEFKIARDFYRAESKNLARKETNS